MSRATRRRAVKGRGHATRSGADLARAREQATTGGRNRLKVSVAPLVTCDDGAAGRAGLCFGGTLRRALVVDRTQGNLVESYSFWVDPSYFRTRLRSPRGCAAPPRLCRPCSTRPANASRGHPQTGASSKPDGNSAAASWSSPSARTSQRRQCPTNVSSLGMFAQHVRPS